MILKTIDPPLRYVEWAVTLEEVPREISLTVSVSNCLYDCHGCHSPYLKNDIGEPLQRDLSALIARYRGFITCVTLMGEGQNVAEQKTALRRIRAERLKTCLYSGCDTVEPFHVMLSLLDYLKIGSYDKRLGGLDCPTTNQRFYRIDNGQQIDETYLFQGKKESQ